MDLYEEIEKIREEGKNAGEEFKKGLTHAISDVKKEFDSFYEVLKSQRDMDLISQEEYYSSLADLRDKYFDASQKEWWKYTAEIYSYEKGKLEDLKKDVENTFSNIVKAAESEIDRIERARDRLAQKLNSFGDLAVEETTVIKGGGRGFYLEDGIYKNEKDLVEKNIVLNDFSKDIQLLSQYKENLEELLNLNVPSEFLDLLESLSIEEGVEYTNLLLKKSPEEFKEIIDNYITKKSLAKDIADIFYQDDFKKVIENFKDATDIELSKLTEKFNSYGKAFMDEIGNGFESAVADVSLRMKEALQNNLFNQLGNLFDEMKISFTAQGAKTYTANYYINGVVPTAGELNIIKRLEAKSQRAAGVL